MAITEATNLPPEFFEQPLTARALEDFATCPRKLLLSYFTPRESELRFRGGSAALHQALREAVLDAWKLGGPAALEANDLAQLFVQHWDGSLCADSLEEDQLRRQGLRLLAGYAEATLHHTATLVEADVHLSGTVGEQTFLAVADLVLCPEEGTLQVLRLSTSRRPLSGSELSGDLSAGLLWRLGRERYRAQAEPVVGIYDLRKNTLREVILEAEHADYLAHRLQSEVARLRREVEFAPRKGAHCRWCRSKARCPAWQG